MAETLTITNTKRLRDEEEPHTFTEESKRFKSAQVEDLSSIFSSLEQELELDLDLELDLELSCNDFVSPSSDNAPAEKLQISDADAGEEKKKENENEKESVIRHLLEASDDELGIPNRVDADEINGGDFSVDGIWEFEDEAANYYTLLQSQLFS